MESQEEREGRSGSSEVCRALGLLLVLLAPVAFLWGLGQLDLQSCMYYGGSDSRCEQGEEMMGVALKVGAAMLVGGAVLVVGSKGEPDDAASGFPRQTAMERYQADLLDLRRQGALTEAHYQTRLLELRSLARQRAEAAISDDEFEAAAARLLDPETDRPLDADEPGLAAR